MSSYVSTTATQLRTCGDRKMPCRPEITGRSPLAHGDIIEEQVRPRAPPSPKLPHIERRAYRIAEFCAAHGVSRAKFYELQKLGLGPHVTDVDGVKIITEEDSTRWRRERSAASRKSTTARKGARPSGAALKEQGGG
jgi:hypothetical protein